MNGPSIGDFLKCPNCHRAGTVNLTIHMDGDISTHCMGCGEMAFGNPLHESPTQFGFINE